MKKLCFGLAFVALALFSTTAVVKAQSPFSAFAGNWMLDKQKTNTSRDFPEKLKNYKMAVEAVETALKVRSQLEGNVEIQSAGRGAMTPVTESASQIRGGASAASSSTGSSSNKVNYGGTMAAFFTPRSAVYNLNNVEEKFETPEGLVRIKAKADKSGKSLQFTTIRRMKMAKGEMEFTIREVWKLSEDGKSLKLERTIESQTTRDELFMTLAKVE